MASALTSIAQPSPPIRDDDRLGLCELLTLQRGADGGHRLGCLWLVEWVQNYVKNRLAHLQN